jgi:ABC-2 type transport system ATP-binding protein
VDAAVAVRDLSKRYGDLTAVDGVSFDVATGEIFGFLGPNGAGKSTTIKMLCTLVAPTSGTATVAGFDIRHEQSAVRRNIGLFFQDPTLDQYLTADQNLRMHAELYGVPRAALAGRLTQVLEMVGLADRRSALVSTYSGGMKRRLEIARGLLHAPHVLFLDEPTVGLDPQTRSSIWRYINDLRKREDITIFLTTHYMDEADRVAHRIAIMDHGSIVAQGTSTELKEQTQTDSLEAAFLALTGSSLRDEGADAGKDRLRQVAQMFQRR